MPHPTAAGRRAAPGNVSRMTMRPIRLLGDAVLRRNAWRFADQLGWAETYDAEYLALTKLQGDALVTLDPELARKVEGIVPTATLDELLAPSR